MQSYTNTTLGGNNAKKLVYSYTDPRTLILSNRYCDKERKLYVIHCYYAQSSKFQHSLQTLQMILD
jgi:hypothetical protein